MWTNAGYTRTGIPYNRLGNGPRPLVVFQGLYPDNAPFSGPLGALLLHGFAFLGRDFTVFVMNRRRGLGQGATLADMADEYAAAIRSELPTPIDVLGMSTGGSIAHEFAARHPALVRHLVLYSSACRMSDEGRLFQRGLAELAGRGQWADFWAEGFGFMFLPHAGAGRTMTRPVVWLIRVVASIFGHPPPNRTDFLVQVAAEDAFDFHDRLHEIGAPTLVIGGERDPFYSPELFRETATGIPNARLVLIPNAGHGPTGRPVQREMLAFLRDSHA